MNDDGYLLRQFAEKRDQACFRELVERRIGFVYAVNLRRLRNAHLAEEATQSVFIALAKKAEHVARSSSIIGWLHRSSCFESHNLMRAQANRISRETEAVRLGILGTGGQIFPPSENLESVLDEVLSELPEVDRQVILARFFSNQSYAEIGTLSGRGENAARMRVERALGKLRERLQKRGLESSVAVLAGALPAYATAAVPSGVVSSVTNAALLGSATVSISTTFLAFMNSTKITAAVAATAIIGVIGVDVYKTNKLEAELLAVRQEHAVSTKAVRDLENQVMALEARPVQPATPASNVGATPAPSPKIELEVPGITRTAPAGWRKNGSNVGAYDVGVDKLESWGGMPSAYVKSISSSSEGSFGGMMQTTSAEAFYGKRVKLSGWVKTEDAKNGGHLWLRIDGKKAGEMLGFDNMNSRAPKGTTDWQEYSVVLDVPNEASTINYGFFVSGSGQMWVNGLTIQPVGSDVPSTEMRQAERALPKAPVNLGFAPD